MRAVRIPLRGRDAERRIGSPGVTPAPEFHHDEAPRKAVDQASVEAGMVAAVESTVVDYLAGGKPLGRLGADGDVRAFGFLIAGATHSLLVSDHAYPNPGIGEVKRMLATVADRLVHPGQKEMPNANA